MTLPCSKIKCIIHKSGFTFIELLVSVGILGIITTIGVASYNNFNDQRVVEKAAEELKTNLRLVQSKAMNNEKDITICGTNPLLGWYANLANQTYYGSCGIGNTFPNPAKNLVDLDINNEHGNNDIILSYNGTILFKALGGTDLTSASDEVVITLTYGSNTNTVTINKTGDIK